MRICPTDKEQPEDPKQRRWNVGENSETVGVMETIGVISWDHYTEGYQFVSCRFVVLNQDSLDRLLNFLQLATVNARYELEEEVESA